MMNIYSHIKSVDHFDQVWNKKISLFSKHFENQPVIACLYSFNITFFLRALADSTIGVSDQIPQNDIIIHEEYCKMDLKTFMINPIGILSFYMRYQPRKKSITQKRLDAFNDSYQSLTVAQKKAVVLPYFFNDFFNIIFASFYPSVRISLLTFMFKNGIIVSDKSNAFVTVVPYHPNTEQIFTMNKSSTSLVYDTMLSDSKDVFDVLKSMQSYIENLIKDNNFVQSSYESLLTKTELQDKQGINGYLMTWH